MAQLLKPLQTLMQSIAFGKLAPLLNSESAIQNDSPVVISSKSMKSELNSSSLQHFEILIGPQYLQVIIDQVDIEDFHVENLLNFHNANLELADVITAMQHWARRNGLKVSINHEHGICFFEKI